MLYFKNKYSGKCRSIFGEPKNNIVNKLVNVCNINTNSKILIPNAGDGMYVMPFARFSKNVFCYEKSDILIYGGIYDNYKSLGLHKRLDGRNLLNNVSIIKKDYYTSNDNQRYDLVLAVKTIQLKENDKYSVNDKISKLMSNVKEGGYLYLTYIIGEDKEVSNNQIIKYNEIVNKINLYEWEIIYYRDNRDRKTIDNFHPYNNNDHFHTLGSILIKRKNVIGPPVKKKRKMNRTYRKASVFGLATQQLDEYSNIIKKELGNNINVLVPNAGDGRNVLYFIKRGFNVTCYETNNVLLNGGNYKGKITSGLYKRLDDWNLKANVVEENYFDRKDIKKYDFVYAENVLSLDNNSNISIRKKVRKLMSNVKEGGYIYIYYDLVKNNGNNSIVEIGQMKKIFLESNFDVQFICERTKSNSVIYNNGKESQVGYIFAKRLRNRRKHRMSYFIELNNNI